MAQSFSNVSVPSTEGSYRGVSDITDPHPVPDFADPHSLETDVESSECPSFTAVGMPEPGALEVMSESSFPRKDQATDQQATGSRRLTGGNVAAEGQNDDEDEKDEKKGSKRSIQLRIVSASDLRQGHVFRSMTPVAVLSVPSSRHRFVTPAASRGSDTFPVWNSMALLELDGDEVALKAQPYYCSTRVQRGSLKCPENMPKRTKSIGAGKLQSNKDWGFVIPKQGTLQGGKSEAPRLLHRSKSGRLVPLQDGTPAVIIDVYSDNDLKVHLGGAAIPLDRALRSRGCPVLGNFDVMRSSFSGKMKSQGSLRVIMTAQ